MVVSQSCLELGGASGQLDGYSVTSVMVWVSAFPSSSLGEGSHDGSFQPVTDKRLAPWSSLDKKRQGKSRSDKGYWQQWHFRSSRVPSVRIALEMSWVAHPLHPRIPDAAAFGLFPLGELETEALGGIIGMSNTGIA